MHAVGAATILQLSDIHVSARPGTPIHGRDPDLRLATVLDAWRARGERADLVLATGDLADDASDEACARLAEVLGSLGAPVVALPGNHDDPGVVARHFDTGPVVDLAAWMVVGVDTTIAGEIHGRVDVDAVTALIDRRVGDERSDRHVLVALHHPPRSYSTHPWFALEHADELLTALAARAKVRGVVSGHTHEPFEERHGQLTLLGAPSTVIGMKHAADTYVAGASPTGALVLRLGDDGELTSDVLVA